MLFKPPSTTFGGHGQVYKKFCETGVICGFPGEGKKPAESTDDNYEDAPLKIMKFHETFRNLKKDVNHSRYYCTSLEKCRIILFIWFSF